MKTVKLLIQGLFYAFVLALLLSQTVTAVISHDENQFVAAGELLGAHGLLPYRDFPYTHMPYAILPYALTAVVSPYEYLAGRILGALTWLACIALIVSISRLLARDDLKAVPPYAALFGEFAIVLVFLYQPISFYVLRAALNHSFATFFSLLGLLFFLRGVHGISSLRSAAFSSGVCIALAGLIRFNYASLVIVLLVLWLVYLATLTSPRLFMPIGWFLGGILVSGLPAIGLVALAPAAFYYGNIVYIRLNTLYYEGILFRQNMDLAAKSQTFFNGLLHSPIDLVLYVMLLVVGIVCLIRFARIRSRLDFSGLTAAAFAGTLWLTAFSPTPTQAHYFFAPLPFMLIIAAPLGALIFRRSRAFAALWFCGLLLALIATVKIPNPVSQLADLLHPSDWTPLQVHDFAVSLKRNVPEGRILTLFSMIPMEAGYDTYPFAATGPFSWRTSLLLTSDRRAYYGVTSPEELPALLDAAPPAGILTGFEAPNAGFKLGELGGLETPFSDYALQHGYKPVSLSPRFLGRSITLWVKPSD